MNSGATYGAINTKAVLNIAIYKGLKVYYLSGSGHHLFFLKINNLLNILYNSPL